MDFIEAADTIAAIATPAGRGAIGIIRVSGPLSLSIAQNILATTPTPKKVHVGNFYAADRTVLDKGLALFFQAPRSFTGEDMLELHAHGNPFILHLLLQELYKYGARDAKNGEFSKRAFLNKKLDLTQAEAIADLINADSLLAARACTRSLQGAFSTKLQHLTEYIAELRALAEALIDFPDDASESPNLEEQQHIIDAIKKCRVNIKNIQECASRGYQLQNAVHITLLGPPNSGKSTLFNALTERKSAITHDTPGTTRDIIEATITINGVSFILSDTAGLRDPQTTNTVEGEGIRRAKISAKSADCILWVYDLHAHKTPPKIPFKNPPHIAIANKCDLAKKPAAVENSNKNTRVQLSARTGEGMDLLREILQTRFTPKKETREEVTDVFSARARHLHLLELLDKSLSTAEKLHQNKMGAELVAEELRLAQNHLGGITGVVHSEMLLEKIFEKFCVGK